MHKILNSELYKRTKRLGWFPLGFASATDNLETLSLCMSAGAPVDQHIPRILGYRRWANSSFYLVGGWRALREAMYRLHVDSIKWLLARGANPNTSVEEEEEWHVDDVPLAYAYRRGFEGNEAAHKARAICLALLEAGADVGAVKDSVQTELLRMRDGGTYLPSEWDAES
jgi:hypothetical protein